MTVSVGRKSKSLGPTRTLTFGTQRIQSADGVTCTLAATDSEVEVSFDIVNPRTEAPKTMVLQLVEGEDFMVINFSGAYVTYKIVFKKGALIKVVEFQNGLINLQNI